MDSRIVGTLVVALGSVLSCGGGPLPSTDTSTSSGESSTSATESSTSATESSTSTTETDTGESTQTETGDPAGACGDGELDEGEACDDGNLDDGDGCSSTCELERRPGPIECGGLVLECGDTLDNDMDGLVDLDDPECTSPCDNVESGLCYGLPVFNFNCNVDCAWDYNAGSGDDGCLGNLECDMLEPGLEIGCEYDPNLGGCDDPPSDACLAGCGPLVPNGCDCFGCCEFAGQTVYLSWWERGNCCSFDDLDSCASCTIDLGCFNPCDSEGCELCFGQGIDALAPGCDEPACPADKDSCASQADCEPGWFCQTGCCTRISASVGD